jgi:hypothetical protein
MSIIQGSAKTGASRGFYPKNINGSLRFNDDDSAYLSWTPASAGNRKTWTWSGWVKRGNLGSGSYMSLFGALDGTNQNSYIVFNTTSQTLEVGQGATVFRRTSAVYRDVSSWYHIVVASDTTAVTPADRLKIYVNGEEITSFSSSTDLSLNGDWYINSTNAHALGAVYPSGSAGFYLDGYLAEVHFTDGTAYDANAFGEFKNGVWVAKTPDVTYGTNGFYLDFQDDTEVEAFNTVLYSGQSTSISVTGVGFQPDFVWVKRRDTSADHRLGDAVRGTGNFLESSTTDAEGSTDIFTSFDSDGFSHGEGAAFNISGGSFVAWNWKANGSGVSNTVGDIVSTVSANTESGFSIVSYTGNGTAGDTVGHGLDVKPDIYIIKNRDVAGAWLVRTDLIDGTSDYGNLNTTTNFESSTVNYATDSVFTLGSSSVDNGSTNEHIAYCFHSVEGFSKFGSYTGNGSADGTFVYTGFRPAFVMIKASSTTGNWQIIDDQRLGYNIDNKLLYPNLSAVESTSGVTADMLSNGFKLRSTAGSLNGSNVTLIYAAFAENPFKYSNAR